MAKASQTFTTRSRDIFVYAESGFLLLPRFKGPPVLASCLIIDVFVRSNTSTCHVVQRLRIDDHPRLVWRRALHPSLWTHRSGVSRVRCGLTGVRSGVSRVICGLTGVRSGVSGVRRGLTGVQSEWSSLWTHRSAERVEFAVDSPECGAQ